jgi:hypothetical protein
MDGEMMLKPLSVGKGLPTSGVSCGEAVLPATLKSACIEATILECSHIGG